MVSEKKTTKKKAKSEENGEKKYVGFWVTEEMKNRWQDFTTENDISSISKFIRNAVDAYIDNYQLFQYLKDPSSLSHALKEPLTSIKGFSEIILNNFSTSLSPDVLKKIKEIFNQSVFMEDKINQIMSEIEPEEGYDVLIIEDDPPTISVLKDFFELKGYTCKGIANGQKGLEEIKNHTPKLVLLDIILPDISGFDICAQIKNDELYKDIPIFYITAIPDTEVEKKMEETKADGYLLKPFKFPDFEPLFSYL